MSAPPKESATCRICRCEATDQHPLFHPCKCRGSIKYIHQDCLQSWLEHSKKETCDICHTQYKFLDLFDSDTPETPPVSLIFKQIIQKLVYLQYCFVKYSLMIFCAGIEVPFFVSSVNRITDWQLGIPVPQIGFLKALFFGDYVPLNKPLNDGLKIWENTIVKGTVIGGIFLSIIGSLVLIQSSIVSDEGFKNIINKKIGLDLKPSAQDIINRRNRNLQEIMQLLDENNDNMLDGAFGDNEREFSDSEHDNLPSRNPETSPETADFHDVESDEESRAAEEAELRHQAELRREEQRRQREQRQRLLLQRVQEMQQEQQRQQLERQQRQQQQQDQQIDDEDNDVNDFWGGPKNISFIVQATILANLVSCAVVITFKLIPSFIGLSAISVFHSILVTLFQFGSSKLASSNSYLVFAHRSYNYILNSGIVEFTGSLLEKSTALKLSVDFFSNNLIIPVYQAYTNIANWDLHNTTSEKALILFFGYFTIGVMIAVIMNRIEKSCSQNNPLHGNYRSIYIILLQLTCVVKVFVLMAIEWVIFPFYGGFQIQFALVAFSSRTIYTAQLDSSVILTDCLGVIPIWFMGTFFMYFFASFVGMIRKEIFRPGVLFFIRPSDDPNVRIIHDALMRPFGLKMSRILLSAGVYTLYIFIEIITPLWAVRLFSPIEVFPAHHKNGLETLLYLSLFIIGRGMSDFFTSFWKIIFDFACLKMRLSSFLLGKDTPKERGRVVYRSFFARFKTGAPDFSNPVLENDVNTFFAEHPDVSSVFIPDGNFVRAPDNETTSRKFIKTLFVPVTKNDQLLEPLPEIIDDEHIFNPYNDDEPMDSTTYTIVYRPPLFKTRIAGFFGILFAASMGFTFGIYVLNTSIKFLFYLVVGDILFPNRFYQIDPYSLFITIAIMANHKLFEPLFVGRDISTIYQTFTQIKEATVRFFNNGTVQYVLAIIRLAIMVPTLVSLGNQKLIIRSSELTWLEIAELQVLLIPFAHALSHKTKSPEDFKFYYYVTFVFIFGRFLSYLYFAYGFGEVSGDFVVNFETFDFQSQHPLFIFIMRYLILNDPLGTEGKIFHTFWVTFSVYRLFSLAMDYWDKFTQEVKQKYYSNGQVLTNVELNDDDEEEKTDINDVSNINNNENPNGIEARVE